MFPSAPHRKLASPVLLVATALAITLGASAPAAALSLSGLTISLTGSNSASELVQAGGTMRTRDSAAAVVSSDATSFTTRYAMVVGADVGNRPTATENMTSSYQITFDVTADAGASWYVILDASRMGALSIVSDGAQGSAMASLGGLTATSSGAGTLTGSLDMAALTPITSGATTDSPFSQFSSAVLSGTGTGAAQTITLGFNWTGSAESTRSGNNGDEAAIRMGLTSAATGFTADDYPGLGSRSMAGDGQFVSAMLVPEPVTAVLLAMGLTGLAVLRRDSARRLSLRAPVVCAG